jgi:hypothetical protein
MGNRAGRRAQPNLNPPYGGGYDPYYYPNSYTLPLPPYQANRRRCRGYSPPQRYY